MTDLQVLYLSGNDLEGQSPARLGNLAALTQMILYTETRNHNL